MVRIQEDKLLKQLMFSSYGWKQKSVKERNVHEKPHIYSIADAVVTIYMMYSCWTAYLCKCITSWLERMLVQSFKAIICTKWGKNITFEQ